MIITDIIPPNVYNKTVFLISILGKIEDIGI